jgi:hypothetical protein
MSYISSPRHLAITLMRSGVLIVTVLLGIYTAFISQASSPDYRRLFWSLSPVAIVHLSFALGYFFWVRHWTRWVSSSVAIVVMAFYGEMTLRVWL